MLQFEPNSNFDSDSRTFGFEPFQVELHEEAELYHPQSGSYFQFCTESSGPVTEPGTVHSWAYPADGDNMAFTRGASARASMEVHPEALGSSEVETSSPGHTLRSSPSGEPLALGSQNNSPPTPANATELELARRKRMREAAGAQQELQAKRMVQRHTETNEVKAVLELGDVCMIDVPEVCRGATDMRRLPVAIVQVNENAAGEPTGFYKVGWAC